NDEVGKEFLLGCEWKITVKGDVNEIMEKGKQAVGKCEENEEICMRRGLCIVWGDEECCGNDAYDEENGSHCGSGGF
ncbi:hypothetical protein, partial [Siminovitchia fortis]|uniref:hypothetical protein n=1 Tax=Siminovitchia fortis TaxID=254758 RepID=UPI001C92F958